MEKYSEATRIKLIRLTRTLALRAAFCGSYVPLGCQHGVGDPLLSMTTLCGTPLTALAFLKKRRAAPRFRRFGSMSKHSTFTLLCVICDLCGAYQTTQRFSVAWSISTPRSAVIS